MVALLLDSSLGDTMLQGLLVTVIGVLLVFIILGFLIAIIMLLKHFNALMNRWDAYMLRFRTMKAEIKGLKKSAKEERSNAILALSKDLSKSDKEKELLEIKNEYCSKTIANKAAITEIHANYDAVSKIEKERYAAISQAKAETRVAIKSAKAEFQRNDPQLAAKKLVFNDELNGKIDAINREYDIKAAAVGQTAENNIMTDGACADDEIMAVISAAVAMIMSENNGYEKKAKFRVRSLKEIKNY